MQSGRALEVRLLRPTLGEDNKVGRPRVMMPLRRTGPFVRVVKVRRLLVALFSLPSTRGEHQVDEVLAVPTLRLRTQKICPTST